jgi:predicted small lipoprotein YifL
MKKTVVALIVVLLSWGLTACGIKEQLEQKAAEKLTETLVEQALGTEDAEIDLDGDSFTIKGKDGEVFTLGVNEWPAEFDFVPKFTKGEIINTAQTPTASVIHFEQVELEDYQEYLEKIKKDFTVESSETSSDEFLFYLGKNEKGEQVVLSYYPETKNMSITAGKTAEEE